MKISYQAIRISVFLALAAQVSPTQAELIGALEKPASGPVATASGIDNVQGWVFTTTPGATVQPLLDVFINGQFVMNVPCCSDRGDVRVVYPQAPLRTGYSGAFNFGLLEFAQHHMEVVAHDTAGGTLTMTADFRAMRVGDFPFVTEAAWIFPGASCTTFNLNGVAAIGCDNIAMLTPSGQITGCLEPNDFFLIWNTGKQNFTVSSTCTAPLF